MSERQELAERLAAFVREHHLDNPFGGDVDKGTNYYSVLFSRPGVLDGLIRLWSPKFILVECRGRLVHGDYSAVYESEQNALKFLTKAFVELDMEGAYEVPVKPPKKNKPT